MRYTLALAIAAAAALVPAAAHGQTAATTPAVAHEQVLSTNPLGEIVQWFNVEYERNNRPRDKRWGRRYEFQLPNSSCHIHRAV
jgi:hypothetical protein